MRKKLTYIVVLLIAVLLSFQQPLTAKAVQNGNRNKDNDEGSKKCTVAFLKGSYGYSYAGTIIGISPISATGVITFDGGGHVSGTYVTNFGRVLEGNVTGTYTADEGCTGTAALGFAALGLTSNASFVVVDKGREIIFQSTDPRLVVTGVAKRL